MANHDYDVVVIGGGLAGLTAAAYASRGAASVLVTDARTEVGGRARTERCDGFSFNQGPHALYRGGAGWPILHDLGVKPAGRTPGIRRAAGVRDGTLVTLRQVAGPSVVRDVLRMLGRRGARAAGGRTTAQWLDECPSLEARQALATLVRVSSYIGDFDRTDATANLAQLRRAMRGVAYLHGGWQQLVDALAAVIDRRGVELRRGAKAAAIEADRSGARVVLGDESVTASAVVIASGGPRQAATLVGDTSDTLSSWAEESVPVVAASLDIALRRLPARHTGPVLGLDEPTYLIPHTPTARLGPEGAALVHAMRYSVDREPGQNHRAGLESLMDLAHPTWRDEVVEVRFGRHLVVAHDRPRPNVEPLDRPSVRLPELPNVFVAGDWITTHGLLADAALASGRDAGLLAATAASAVTAAAAPRVTL